ncbi:hypothetical protein PTNB73_04629 [Pyrenophora teres f. teres]|nr:hypothetical protein HRS9139_04771 [Pyrenophora teres f. teres]KAE8869576.1 hypothetical protein PTNB73_04629 [Pyrenophora teres f. teres]
MVYSNLSAGRVPGMEACSMPYDNPDCPICLERYQSNALVLYDAAYASAISRAAKTTTRAVASEPQAAISDHTPIKLPCCRNKIGRDCLNTWLRVSDICPLCRAKIVVPPPIVIIRRFIDWVFRLVDFESAVVVYLPLPVTPVVVYPRSQDSMTAHAPLQGADYDDTDNSGSHDYGYDHNESNYDYEDYGVLPLFCGW